MKLSVSNIAWREEQDEEVFAWMKEYGYAGLEIAPTRIFPENPYDKLTDAKNWAERLKADYGFSVPSMQSIWYGMPQRIAGSPEERAALYDYTEQALDFAAACRCRNLVFGCPKNRVVSGEEDIPVNEQFLWDIAEAAEKRQVIIGLEANPPVYQTNYINTTSQAVEVLRRLNHPALKLNLDLGTILANQESLDVVENNVDLICHIHISEPGLKPVKKRGLHRQLKTILEAENYQGVVSIEMGQTDDINSVEDVLKYVREVFGS